MVTHSSPTKNCKLWKINSRRNCRSTRLPHNDVLLHENTQAITNKLQVALTLQITQARDIRIPEFTAECWRKVSMKFSWAIWSMFGWLALVACAVCAWVAINPNNAPVHHSAGVLSLFSVGAVTFGVLSLGIFMARAISLARWIWSGARRVLRIDSRG